MFNPDSNMDGWTMPIYAFAIKGKNVTFTAYACMKHYLETKRITVQKLGRCFTLPTSKFYEQPRIHRKIISFY